MPDTHAPTMLIVRDRSGFEEPLLATCYPVTAADVLDACLGRCQAGDSVRVMWRINEWVTSWTSSWPLSLEEIYGIAKYPPGIRQSGVLPRDNKISTRSADWGRWGRLLLLRVEGPPYWRWPRFYVELAQGRLILRFGWRYRARVMCWLVRSRRWKYAL